MWQNVGVRWAAARVVAEDGRAVGWGHTGRPPPAVVVWEVSFLCVFLWIGVVGIGIFLLNLWWILRSLIFSDFFAHFF